MTQLIPSIIARLYDTFSECLIPNINIQKIESSNILVFRYFDMYPDILDIQSGKTTGQT